MELLTRLNTHRDQYLAVSQKFRQTYKVAKSSCKHRFHC